MKVALYARVSTEDQHAEKQIEACKEFCIREKHEIYKSYIDTISGSKADRPAFNELLEDKMQENTSCQERKKKTEQSLFIALNAGGKTSE